MRFIHCSDIHLDSAMRNLKEGKAKERKDELRLSFEGMIKAAKENDVKAVIIAGDMFDKTVLKKTENYIFDLFSTYTDIDFLYLSGNHDEQNVIEAMGKKLSNVRLLTNEPIEYGNIRIYGFKPTSESSYDSLFLDKNKTNIVVVHGQVDDYSYGKDYVNLRKLKNKNIDYLAMGHIHSFNEFKLDERGVAVYSGCLEGRGFDEIGPKGFIALEVNNGKINYAFNACSRRILYEIKVDITLARTVKEIDKLIFESVKDISRENLIKVVLCGNITIETEKDLDHFEKVLNDEFYFATVRDETKLLIDIDSVKNDISLKGEFIKRVLESNINEKSKERVIMYGIKALNGEEIE